MTMSIIRKTLWVLNALFILSAVTVWVFKAPSLWVFGLSVGSVACSLAVFIIGIMIARRQPVEPPPLDPTPRRAWADEDTSDVGLDLLTPVPSGYLSTTSSERDHA
jgi:hypothetical protein